MANKKFDIKVKHIIEYLQTLDPEMSTSLDHDGWMYDVVDAQNEVDVVSKRGLFDVFEYKGKKSLIINN